MLNVGDVIWQSSQFGSATSYAVHKIIRVTAKHAVVNNSLRLYREGYKDWHNSECYRRVGGGSYFYVMTDEVRKKIAQKNKIDKIKKWFEDRQFSDEELEKIYIFMNPDEKI